MNPASIGKPKIIFFLRNGMPENDEVEAAKEIADKGAQVVFRVGKYVPTDGAYEECDGVAGEVPDRYKDAMTNDKRTFPDADEAIANFDGVRDGWNRHPDMLPPGAEKPATDGPYVSSDPGPQTSQSTTIPATGGKKSAVQERAAAAGAPKGAATPAGWQKNA
jgi:hypothetical protein